MNLTYLEHSGMAVEDEDVCLIIDPWPQSEEVEKVARSLDPDFILLTHGHFDHVGIALELSKEKNAPIVAVPELAAYCRNQGVEAELVNFGGAFEGEGFSAKCVPAWHSSSVGEDRVYAGNPCGFVVRTAGGSLYHAGDTCLFGDMRLIGDSGIDIAAIPIGGRTTMDPQEALAAIELLRPKNVIPIHVNTWPFIKQDVAAFCDAVKERYSVAALVPEAGKRTKLPV